MHSDRCEICDCRPAWVDGLCSTCTEAMQRADEALARLEPGEPGPVLWELARAVAAQVPGFALGGAR